MRNRREDLIDRTLQAVQERLTKEINHWDRRAQELREQERAGKPNARINSARAQQRADDLAERLERRKQELALERQISPLTPVVIGRALIVPAGMVYPNETREFVDRRITEQVAMKAVMDTEISLGHSPRDVSKDNEGYDVESIDGETGRLRFIEVKGRRAGAETVTITRNEILTALNKPEAFILALVEIDGKDVRSLHYLRQLPFSEPGFSVTSVNYNREELVRLSEDITNG